MSAAESAHKRHTFSTVMGRSYARRCHSCRTRKVKCDRSLPACRRCVEHSILCPGYFKEIEFIHLDQNSMQKVTQSGLRAWRHNESVSSQLRKNNETATRLFARPNQDHSRHINIQMNQILAVPQNKAWFISLLEGSYVPIYPVKPSITGAKSCSSWIRKACALTTTSIPATMLDNALLAISLAMVGGDTRNSDSLIESFRLYSDALVGLRQGLQYGSEGLDEHQIDVHLVTGLSCGMYEMVANRSFEDLLRHLNGVGAILNARGVQNIQSAIGRRSFYEFRSIYLPVSLAMRKPSFLSLSEWIDPPWKATEPHSTTYLQTVIDIGYRIPPLMETLDQLRNSADLLLHDCIAAQKIINNMSFVASKLQSDLDAWEAQLTRLHDLSHFYISRPARKIESPHIDDFGILFPVSYNFPNWDIASGLIYHETIQIFLNNFTLQLISFARSNNFTLSTLQSYPTRSSIDAADRICQSLEYFFEDNKKLIGRMVILAPFECARALYAQIMTVGTGDAELDVEIQRKSLFCEKVTKRIQEGGLPNWAKSTS